MAVYFAWLGRLNRFFRTNCSASVHSHRGRNYVNGNENIKAIEGSFTIASSPFDLLSDELILEIMKALPVQDMLAFSMTGQRFHRIVQSPIVWASQARTQLANSYPLIFPPNISDFIAKQRVVSLFRLEDTFAAVIQDSVKTTSKCVRAITLNSMSPTSFTTKPGQWKIGTDEKAICITPRHVLVVRDNADAERNGAQELVGYDAESSECKRVTIDGTLRSLRWDWMSNSFYCIAVACLDGPRDILQLTFTRNYICESTPPFTSSTPRVATSAHNTNMVIGVPNNTYASGLIAGSKTNFGFLTSNTLARLQMPYSVDVDVRILDPSARMAVVLFEIWNSSRRRGWFDGSEPASRLGLAIVLDWETRESVVVDTGLPFNHRNTSALVHCDLDCSNLLVRTEGNIVDCVGTSGADIAESAPENERSVRRVRARLLALDRVKRRAKRWGEVVEETWKATKSTSGGATKWVVDGDLLRKTAEEDIWGVWRAPTQIDYEWGDLAVRTLVDEASDSSGKFSSTSAKLHLSNLTRTISPSYPLRSTSSSSLQHLAPPVQMENSELLYTWVQNEDWPMFRGGPNERAGHDAHSRVSSVALYSIAPRHSTEGAGAEMNKAWYLVQSYAEMLDCGGVKSCVDAVANATTVTSYPPPITVPLCNPVLVECIVGSARNLRATKAPLMAVTFNYVLWVEEILVEEALPAKKLTIKPVRKLMKQKKHLGQSSANTSPTGHIMLEKVRRLRLASFHGLEGARLSPHISSSQIQNERMEVSSTSVSRLDIPQAILWRARQLLFDEVEAAVSIVCNDGDVYSYPIV